MISAHAWFGIKAYSDHLEPGGASLNFVISVAEEQSFQRRDTPVTRAS